MNKKQKQEALWKELLGQNPSVNNLLKIADNMPDLRYKAWQELSNRKITDEELVYAMRYCGLANEAGQQLLERERSKKNLLIVVEFCAGSISDETTQELMEMKQELSNEELRVIVQFDGEFFSDEAGEELMKRDDPNYENLHHNIRYGGKFLSNKAGKELLGRNPTKYGLSLVMRYCVKPLNDEAWQKFLKQEPDEYELRSIVVEPNMPPAFKNQAQRLLNRSNSNIIAEMQMLDEGLWLRFKTWVAKHIVIVE